MNQKTPKMKSMFGGAPSGGFFDLPVAEPGDTRNADIVLIGAPAATPYESVGSYCAEAPDAIRGAFGWPGVLGHHDFDIDGHLLPAGISALDWGNLDYSETDFDDNRDSIRRRVGQVLGNWMHTLTGATKSTAKPWDYRVTCAAPPKWDGSKTSSRLVRAASAARDRRTGRTRSTGA
jgi:hypothetical protein